MNSHERAVALSEPAETTTDETPRPGRFVGWRMVAVAFLTQGLSTGATIYVYGVFLKPLAAEFEASRMTTGLGLSAMYAVQGLVSPALGRALDQRSIRTIMLWGALLMGGGLALISATTALWQIGLVFASVVGVGAAMVGPLSASTLVANWFSRSRGRALGLAAMGTSFFGFLLPPLAAMTIADVGWRATSLFLGLGATLILVPVIGALVVSRPEECGTTPDGLPHDDAQAEATRGVAWTWQALVRERDFWAIAAGIALLSAAAVALLTHFVAFATDRGVPPQRAALLLSVAAGFGMAGKLVFGALVDRISERPAFWLMVVVQSIAWTLLLGTPDYAQLLFAACLFGLGTGGNLPISGALVAATFGRAAFGRVMGLMTPLMLVLTVVSPPLAGYLFDRTGNYELAFRILLGTTIVAAAPIALLRTRRRGMPPAGR